MIAVSVRKHSTPRQNTAELNRFLWPAGGCFSFCVPEVTKHPECVNPFCYKDVLLCGFIVFICGDICEQVVLKS